MTRLACKLFLDECLSPEIIESYIKPHLQCLELTAEVKHLREKFGPNSRYKDRDFVPVLARHPNWVIISSDRAKQCKKIESLILACREHLVTLVCLTTSVIEKGVAYQGAQLLAHWDAMVEAVSPRGGHYHIRMTDSGIGSTIFRPVRCPAGYIARKESCIKPAT